MEGVTAIIALVATCGQIVQYTFTIIIGLDELRARLNNVEVDVNALRAEIELIRTAVEKLSEWLNTNPPQEREESVRSLRRSLDACEDVLSLLHNEIERDRKRIEKDLEKNGRISLKHRLFHIYRQDQINIYRQKLAYQLNALNFHLGTNQL
jgi:septal ring factor EnvC (AmiA/AmiB activator)